MAASSEGRIPFENASLLARQLGAVERLIHRLEQARDHLMALFPLKVDTFDPEELPPETAFGIDAFRVRFGDLQDLLGRAVFRSLARADEDELPGDELTTRERIALMEKRGLLDTDQWRAIREVRNTFAHEYPDDDAEKAAHLNAAWELTATLLEVGRRCVTYAREEHGVMPE